MEVMVVISIGLRTQRAKRWFFVFKEFSSIRPGRPKEVHTVEKIASGTGRLTPSMEVGRAGPAFATPCKNRRILVSSTPVLAPTEHI